MRYKLLSPIQRFEYAVSLSPLFDFRRGGFIERSKDKMRRHIKRFFITIGVLSILFVLLIVAFCDVRIAYADGGKSEEELKEELSQAVEQAINGLNTDELDKFVDSLDIEEQSALGIESIKRMLLELVNGTSKDFFSSFLNAFGSTIGRYFAGFLPSFVTIIIICLLNSLLAGLTSDFLNGSTSEVAHIMCYCAIVIVLMSGMASVISEVSRTVQGLMTFASVLFPILLTLLSMLGGATAMAIYSPFMAALSTVIMKLVTSVILPAFVATIVFSVVGSISKNVRLNKLVKLIKSASGWLIGIIFGMYATFLTVQGISGGLVDKFGFNLAKFALSSYVPILGGYLSDGFDLLSASLVLVKNAVGYTGVIILLAAVLFPLVKVVIFSLTLRLTAAVAEPIGDSRVATLMSDLASNMNLLITALAGTAFLFFILLMLLIGSANYGI